MISFNCCRFSTTTDYMLLPMSTTQFQLPTFNLFSSSIYSSNPFSHCGMIFIPSFFSRSFSSTLLAGRGAGRGNSAVVHGTTSTGIAYARTMACAKSNQEHCPSLVQWYNPKRSPLTMERIWLHTCTV